MNNYRNIIKYENLENNIKEILLNIGFKEEDINHKRIFYNQHHCELDHFPAFLLTTL